MSMNRSPGDCQILIIVIRIIIENKYNQNTYTQQSEKCKKKY